MNSLNQEQRGRLKRALECDDKHFGKANRRRAGYYVTQRPEGPPSGRTYQNIQFNSGQPEDCDNMQWRALEIMSVQLGRSLTPQILNSSQRPCRKANARPYPWIWPSPICRSTHTQYTSGVGLGEWFGAGEVCAPPSDHDHPMTLLSIVGALQRPNGEGLEKPTENAGIDG
jgi:hypothetical protein